MARCLTCRQGLPQWAIESLLSSSQDRQLCIPPPSTQPHSVLNRHQQQGIPNELSYIDKIPNETLNDIVNYALPCKFASYSSYRTALALSLVCRRFHRIVQPIMYNTLDFSSHSLVQPCTAVKLLHRSMEANPALGAMVVCLLLHLEYRTPVLPLDPIFEANFTIAKELMGWMENVEELEIQGGYGHPSTWPVMMDAARKWKRLRVVSLKRVKRDWSLLMTPVCEFFMATPSLTKLNLYGISSSRRQNNTLQTPPPKNMERTSAITHLFIYHFGDSFEALSNLLKLPRLLTHFSFGRIYINKVPWQMERFQTLLEPHQDTLQRVEIGGPLSFRSTPMTAISFLPFPSLEILQLNYWIYRATPEIAASSLLAPRLHTFIWDFTVLDNLGQHNENWTSFTFEQKEWLLTFCKLAKEKQSALKKFEILFSPHKLFDPTTKEQLEGIVKFWKLMDQVRDVVKGFEVELVYEARTIEELLKRFESEE